MDSEEKDIEPKINEETHNDEFLPPSDGDEYYGEPVTLKEKIVNLLKSALNYTALSSLLPGATREFNEFEYKLIRHLFKCFADYEQNISSWLFEYIDVNDVKFVWNMNLHTSGIMGSFNPLHPKQIQVSDIAHFTTRVMLNKGFEEDDPDGVIGYSPIASEFKPRWNDVNTAVCGIMINNFATIVHEMTHMFQCGIACKVKEDASFWEIFRLKVVLPVGYVFNRLYTAFVDNPLVDNIVIKVHQLLHPNDFEYNTDDAHLPFFYKFTLEYDVDETIEKSVKLKEFVEKLDRALTSVCFKYRQDPLDPENAHVHVGCTPEELAEMKESHEMTVQMAMEENGPKIWKYAEELYQMHVEERDRILAKHGYKKEK